MNKMPPATVINTEAVHPWLSDDQKLVNADFTQRAIMLPAETLWQATGFDGLEIRILEYITGPNYRLTAQVRTTAAVARSSLYTHTGLEILVQSGELTDQNSVYPSGLYLRDPTRHTHIDPAEQLHFGSVESTIQDSQSGLLYLSLGQMAEEDTEMRRINTYDEELWLPGPVSGTEVMPLHMHGTSNSMLLRWTDDASFKPRLDPKGEEILVLKGTLSDVRGSYNTGSWIRNPIETWQSWSAEAGTIIYYKNGHFPDQLT